MTIKAHGHIRQTAATPKNIARVEQMILESRRVTVWHFAAEVNFSVGSVETIIHGHLRFRNISGNLTFDQEGERITVCEQLQNRSEDDEFLQPIITSGET